MPSGPDAGQPTFEGMPERLYAATPARIATYLDCPRRYRLAYLDRPAPARTAARAGTSIGASVHTALARWWTLPTPRRTPEAGGALLLECWIGEGFRNPAQSRAAQARARVDVERYLGGVDPAHDPLAVERTVAVRTPRASLWGRVDRVDDRGDEGVVVVDYKTGRHVPRAADARDSLALAVYAAGVAATLRRPCTRVELHHLPSGEVAAFDHDESSLDRHLGLADHTAARLAELDAGHPAMTLAERRDAFPAQVARRCGSCEMRPSCGPGQSVPAEAPWSGVPG